ncbi:MAG: hypothetical protein PHG44_03460 [Lentisphaeria bacterium]|jgi:hypothetical protein|nr:hypothetical protein [Lentisphaeria bacterium]MDY0176163.1 hypothetical protein [Lentisphaeria bacterium]NLZ59349.1 hypothetical protein [Lentisphaerota bacterium]
MFFSTFFQRLFLFGLFCLLALSSSAQVALQLKAESARYLRYEIINLRLVINNSSGNTLIFSDQDGVSGGRLFFAVNEHSGKVAKAIDAKANPIADLILAPGESRELQISINMLHDMQKEGVYSVTAYLNHSRLPRTHLSNTINVEVIEGSRILERSVGLPSQSSSELIKSMRLILLLFPDVSEKLYCLRVEDDDNIYAVHRLGPYISGTPPQMDVDGSSSVHVLIQVRPRLYSYLIYSFMGRNLQLRQQRYYVPDGGTPSLSKQTGYLRVSHARPANEGTDYNLKRP